MGVARVLWAWPTCMGVARVLWAWPTCMGVARVLWAWPICMGVARVLWAWPTCMGVASICIMTEQRWGMAMGILLSFSVNVLIMFSACSYSSGRSSSSESLIRLSADTLLVEGSAPSWSETKYNEYISKYSMQKHQI